MDKKITSATNPKLVHIRKLLNDNKYRDECREFVIEGEKFINEVSIENISYVVVSDRIKDIKATLRTVAFYVPNTIFLKITDTESPQGILAVVKQPSYSLKDVTKGLWIIAEGIQDPGNLGTIIRTIEAAGTAGLIYTTGTVDPYSPKVVRASAGAILRIPVIHCSDIRSLHSTIPTMTLFATVITEGRNYKDISYPELSGIILGSEGQGLSEAALSLADEKVSIPLQGKAESLNVAITAGILLFSR